MENKKHIIDKTLSLEKYPGKGGWTYAAIPELKPDKKAPFGWVRVSGWIDDYELKQYKLMPMGNGQLFLPVKAAIRKKIGKQAGDQVRIRLSLDETPLIIPQEILDCFKDVSPKVYAAFQNLSEGEKKHFLDSVLNARKEETKTQHILKMISHLENKTD